ncbi:ComF family protein [Wenzhouxiangella sp. 15181]|nr:ComF family protein [Wenzhouxiangella sp. 15181]RFP68146.1 ComF family protein [Wenzhouxiangella sp. 15190]
MRLESVTSGFGRWLLPPVCLICGQRAREGLDCCSGCAADLPVIDSQCHSCGLAMPAPTHACGRCTRRPPAFDRTWPGFAYAGPIERLVHRFKFHHDLAAGRVLAGLCARRLAAIGAPRPQALVPVPLHWRRHLWRGFNQSRMLAEDLSGFLGGIPVAPLLSRSRATPAQSGLPAASRGANVRNAFRAHLPACRPRHVALVDDVMTTGTTLDACARALKKTGIERVDVWVVARA